MFKKIIILLFFISFCGSQDYQTDFETQVVRSHQNFYGLPNSTDPSDIFSITVKVKTECQHIKSEIKKIDDENNKSEKVIDDHYISFRKPFKSDYEDSTGARETLEKQPQEILEYLEILYKYCNLEDFFRDNWKNLETRENSFLTKS